MLTFALKILEMSEYNKNEICILASVHPAFDGRIFHKEAKE